MARTPPFSLFAFHGHGLTEGHDSRGCLTWVPNSASYMYDSPEEQPKRGSGIVCYDFFRTLLIIQRLVLKWEIIRPRHFPDTILSNNYQVSEPMES